MIAPMRTVVFVGLLLAVGRPAFAHDYWIEPGQFRVGLKDKVQVQLKVGSKKDLKVVTPGPDRIVRLEGVSAKGAHPLTKMALAVPQAGDVLLVYTSNHAYIELEPKKFESYLRHEGLDAIVAERARAKETDKTGTESYARNAKALLTVGHRTHDFDKVLGLTLELVPLKDPRQAGQPLHFRLLFKGKPLAGARTDLMPLKDLTQEAPATTDANGEVSYPPPPAGTYLLAATHMVRASKAIKGDWESQWATFAFEVEVAQSK